jgi:hypothetical protein
MRVLQKTEATPCVIYSSRLVTDSTPDRTSERIQILYRYSYKGHAYTSAHVGMEIMGHFRRQHFIARYPPGSHATCYVFPTSPKRAVLDRSLPGEIVAFLAILLLIGIGAVWAFISSPRIVISEWRRWRKHVVPGNVPPSREPIPFKGQANPRTEFITLLVAILFWNALLALIFYATFLAPQTPEDAIFEDTPPVQVIALWLGCGLLPVCGMLSPFLAIFHPHLRLSSRTHTVPLGEDFHCAWEIIGPAEKFRSLRITLEGQESIGLGLSAKTQTFASIPILESIHSTPPVQGNAQITVPGNLMHTLNGRRVRVSWLLRVRGEMSHWPHLRRQYPVVVLPQAAGG